MSVNDFLAPIHVRLSPNFVGHPLDTGDEVIKFWKVKVKDRGRWGRYALDQASSCLVMSHCIHAESHRQRISHESVYNGKTVKDFM